jgi:hypothetical protein
MIPVCGYSGLFRMEDRQARNRPDLFFLKANVVQEEGVQTGILLMLSFLPEEKISEISTGLEARRK